VHETNVSVFGNGVIDGVGYYWYPNFFNGTARPHLIEMLNVSGLEISGVTLLNSAFWTLHPVYCSNVHIHHINITAPWCENYACANTDGIDVDSSTNVVIEESFIGCGDDHVTIIAGQNEAGRAFNMSSRNVTVRHLVLGTGMGLSIGSSVSGGVEDVLYEYNVMAEDMSEWGQGTHIKTQAARGGFVRNITWQHSVFNAVSNSGMEIETDYQGSSGGCNSLNCTEIRDITFKNLTFNNVGSPGSFQCFPPRPCINVNWINITVNSTGAWGCAHVASGTVTNVLPRGLAQACGL